MVGHKILWFAEKHNGWQKNTMVGNKNKMIGQKKNTMLGQKTQMLGQKYNMLAQKKWYQYQRSKRGSPILN